jgi:hypothetical protein
MLYQIDSYTIRHCRNMRLLATRIQEVEMIVLRNFATPELGKTTDMVDSVREWVGHYESKGKPATASRQLFSSGRPIISGTTFFENLGALDEHREAGKHDQENRRIVRKFADAADGQVSTQIFDQVVPVQLTAGLPISLVASVTSKSDMTGDLRSLLSDWVKHNQSRGIHTALLEQIFSGKPPVLIQRSTYESLATLDEDRQSWSTSAEYKEFLGKFSKFADGFPKWMITENIASTG